MMLHMDNVVFHNETQCLNTPSDYAPIVHLRIRNPLHQVREERVVSIPEIDQAAPLHVPVSMRLHPLILRITLPAKFAVNRRQHEPHVVVCCRVDQVPQLFFARPCPGLRRLEGR